MSKIDENAELILRNRYYQKDKDGNILENWDQLCRRVVDNIITEESVLDYSYTDMRELCYDMIHNLDFLPNSPTLSNAGTEQCLSACFVCPLENTIESIFQTIHDAVMIHKSGGGTGFNFTKIKRDKLINFEEVKFGVTLSENHKDFDEFTYNDFKYLDKYVTEQLNKKINLFRETEDKYSITLYGINNSVSNTQLLVIDINDSMDDIFNFNKLYNTINLIKDKNKQIIFNFNNVRSKNSLISTTNTKASGPVSFMNAYDAFIEYITNNITPITTIKFFNACTESVKQGGMRRGANMGILNYDSEFIEEFICCKQNNSAINNFNISVGVTDDRLFAHVNGHGDEDEVHLKDYSNKNVRLTDKTISLSKLFDDLVYFAWKNGEPGVIFLDKINAKNPVPNTVIESTNPCFTGDMKLLTENGYKTFEELCDTEVKIINGEGILSKGKVWCSGEKDVIELTFSNEKIVRCTPNHIFRTSDFKEIEAKYLKDSNKQILSFTANILKTDSPTCIDMKELGRMKVYDFEEPKTHWGVVEDFIVHNCGEQPLLPYESCNLGSINLANMVGKNEQGQPVIRLSHLRQTIRLAIRFMDAVIDVNKYPLPIIEKNTKATRKIGLGVMGLADLFAFLGINYDSEEALSLSEKLAQLLESEATKAAYQLYEYKINHTNIDNVRNYSVTTIAPTGTLSTLCNVSGGIEPFFSVVHKRTTLGGEKEIFVVNPRFKSDLTEYVKSIYPNYDTFNLTKELDKIIADVYNKGLKNTDLPDYLKNRYKSASDISYKWHIDHQDAWQKYIDNAISKTINFPNDATQEMVKESYIRAYEGNCKGITIYRDKSRNVQILNTGNSEESKINHVEENVKETIKCETTAINENGDVSTTYSEFNIPKTATATGLTMSSTNTDTTEYMNGSVSAYTNYSGTYHNPNYVGEDHGAHIYKNKEIVDVYTYPLTSEGNNYPLSTESSTITVPKSKTTIDPGRNDMVDTLTYSADKYLKDIKLPIHHGNTISNIQPTHKIRERHKVLQGYTEKLTIGCGSLYVTVNFDDDGIREIFVNNGKNGGCASQTEATTRLLSTALKYGMPYDVLEDQLKGIRCPSCIRNKNAEALSCPDAIIKCVSRCIKQHEESKKFFTLLEHNPNKEYIGTTARSINDDPDPNVKISYTTDTSSISNYCPECGTPLDFEGGCCICRLCGYSKCH